MAKKNKTDKVSLHGNQVLKIEKLGPEATTEVYEMRSQGCTYKEIQDFLLNSYNFKANIPMLQRFFHKYNVVKDESQLKNNPAKNQIVRRKEMERRIDMVSNILENQLIEVKKDDKMSTGNKAAKVGELCRVMLDTINKDVYSQQDFKKGNSQSNTNVQVNVGDQLKEVAKKKENLKREILSADHKQIEGEHSSTKNMEEDSGEDSNNEDQKTDNQ